MRAANSAGATVTGQIATTNTHKLGPKYLKQKDAQHVKAGPVLTQNTFCS